VVGIALVLSAVFVPTVFIPGITGRLYQQFALTIAISVIVSAFNALTLSPALSALLLRPHKKTHGPLARFFDWFNRKFASGTNFYLRISGGLIRKSALAVALRWRPLRSPVAFLPRCCLPASCPTRTRDTCTSRCNSRSLFVQSTSEQPRPWKMS
jgi:Cu/Ag efflux pump CusA